MAGANEFGTLLLNIRAGTADFDRDMKRAATQAKAGAAGIEGSFAKLKPRVEGVRSAMSAFGAASQSALGQTAAMVSGLVTMATQATIVGAALAGVGIAIAKMVEHAKAQERLAKQAAALGTAYGVTSRQIESVKDALAAAGIEADRSMVQNIVAAGRAAGLTTDEIANLAGKIKLAADLTGKDYAAAAGSAFAGAKSAADALITKLDEAIRKQRIVAAGGDPNRIEVEDANLEIERQAADLRGHRLDLSMQLRREEERLASLQTKLASQRKGGVVFDPHGQRAAIEEQAEKVRQLRAEYSRLGIEIEKVAGKTSTLTESADELARQTRFQKYIDGLRREAEDRQKKREDDARRRREEAARAVERHREQIATALAGVEKQARQLGMTDGERSLDDFLELKPKTLEQVERYKAALAAIEQHAKATAAYTARVAEKTAVLDSLASLSDQLSDAQLELSMFGADNPRDIEYARLRERYYAQGGRSAWDDADFERKFEALRGVNQELDAMRQKQALAAEAASRASGVLANMFVAPLRDGFKGISDMVDMLKQALIDLVQEMAAALFKSGIIKILSAALNMISPGSGEVFSGIAGVATSGVGSGGSEFQLQTGAGWGNGTTGYAGGGKVLGPGGPTSDSVRLWGSRGEWMIQQKAAAHYGDRVMAAINSMRIPRAALQAVAAGGMTGMPIPGRGETHYHFASLDPLTGLEMMRAVVAPGLGRHLRDGTAGLLPAQLRAATAAPRAS